MQPTFWTDLLNLLLFPVFIVEVLLQTLSVAARGIGYLP